MRLLSLLFLFIFSIHAIDTELSGPGNGKDGKNCGKDTIPSLHGSYKDKDGLVWTCTQLGKEVTLRAGASKEGNGKFQLNDNCVWNAEIQWTIGDSGSTQVKLVFNEDKDVKIKSKDDDSKVWARFDRGPKLLGYWRDNYGKDWRCLQPYSLVYCWDQRGRETRSLLERLKATDPWTATTNFIGETTPNTKLTINSDKQITFANGDVWNRLECEYKFKCNTDMPNVAGTYKDQGGKEWKITQTGTKIVIKGDGKTINGLLRQRPNRCFWGILVDGFRQGLETGQYVELALRPNALFLTVFTPPDYFGDVTDKWKSTATRLEESTAAEGTLLVRN